MGKALTHGGNSSFPGLIAGYILFNRNASAKEVFLKTKGCKNDTI